MSVLQKFLRLLNRQTLPDSVLSLYQQEWESLHKIEPTLRMLDNGQYSAEFLFYIGIKQQIDRNLGEYKGLGHFIELFSFVLKNLKFFYVLDRVELDFRDQTQLQLYQFIEVQLNSCAPSKSIRKAIRNELKEVISTTQNKSVKEALISYKSALESIIFRKSGVKLLGALKQTKITNYSIFEVFYSLIQEAEKKNLQQLKPIVLMVKKKENDLDKIFQSIGFPSSGNKAIVGNNPIIYAKIIQYIALYFRYNPITFRFEQFLEMLKKWLQHYQIIITLQKKYPVSKYHYPSQGSETIPALSIYLKYKNFIL